MERLLACPHCHKAVRLASTVTGPVKAVCPVCRRPFLVPAAVPVKKVLEVKPIEEAVLEVKPVEEEVIEVKPVEEEVLDALPADLPPPTPTQAKKSRPVAIPVSPSIPKPRRTAEVVPTAQPAEEGVTPLTDKSARTPRRSGGKGPPFTDGKPAPRRQTTNRAVVVSAVIAGLVAMGWWSSFLPTSTGGLVAMLFLGSVFGGIFASTSTGVGRFRHSLYAGLWAFGVFLVFAIPAYFLIVWYGSQMSLLASSKEADDPALVAFRQMESGLGMVLWSMALAPFLMVTGFVLGGGMDVLVTAVARSLGSREKWTYHTSDGKSFPVSGPWRNPTLAAAWSFTGWALLLTCWVPLLSSNLIGTLAAFALGQACRSLAKKHRATSARDVLEKDRRPPIIYLRSFQDDGLFQPGTFFLINDWLRTLNERTAEDNLSTALAPFGPVVAIGRPGEEMPEVGAARIYVGDDHWKDLILDLLTERGALAVFQAGATKGLRWELETVASRLRPEQLLMFLPFNLHWSRARRNAGYADFRAWATECAPAGLPEAVGDGVYFFYFVDKGKVQTRVLDKTAVPKSHPLSEVLRDLQSSQALRPWRLMNWKRFFKLLLWGILLGAVSVGVKALWHWAVDSPPAPQEVPLKEGAKPPPAGPQKEANPTRYEGKARPYHLTLGPAWTQKEAKGNPDLYFSRGELVELRVVVSDQRDLGDAAKDYAEKMRSAKTPAGVPHFDKVTILENRIVPVREEDWNDFKLEVVMEGHKYLQHVRCYSGPEGTFFLLGTYPENDPALDRELTRVFDSFELPPAP